MRLKVEAGCGNTRHFIGEMREKNRKARPGYAPFRRRDRDRTGTGGIII